MHFVPWRYLKPKSILKFPSPRDTRFKEPKPSSRRVQFMLPGVEGEWPLVNQPDGKRWRTNSAYRHGKTVLKKSGPAKSLEFMTAEHCDDDPNVAVMNDGPKIAKPLTSIESKLIPEDFYEKLRHYYRWASSAHRAMHDGHSFVDQVCNNQSQFLNACPRCCTSSSRLLFKLF